jgi:hypothetical protein
MCRYNISKTIIARKNTRLPDSGDIVKYFDNKYKEVRLGYVRNVTTIRNFYCCKIIPKNEEDKTYEFTDSSRLCKIKSSRVEIVHYWERLRYKNANIVLPTLKIIKNV